IKKDGIEVEAAEGLAAFIKKSDLSKHKDEQRPERFAVGDKVDAKVLGFDKASRQLSLSIKAHEIEEEKKAIAEFGST
ncbi:MAG: S1 RNA-binding domain-containing protein, partial [Candidatus Midichloria sp.]|nr:S1 RNA-binding domain-containing protein [Candidatus Midichloria sp.]